MFIIVVGCGRVGSELSYGLYKKGHQVAVIDFVGGSFEHLPPDYRGRTIEAEVLADGILARAGIGEADGLAAVTNSDSVNAVVGHVARSVYKVPNVVVRNYDPRWRPLFETFGLQVVSSTAWGAQRIEELLYQRGSRTVFSAGNGEVEVQELVVPAAWVGKPLSEVLPAAGCVPVALTRGGKAMLPGMALRLEAADILHLSVTLEGVEALRQRLEAGR
jgi:trk system potassium uptake protein TrkA